MELMASKKRNVGYSAMIFLMDSHLLGIVQRYSLDIDLKGDQFPMCLSGLWLYKNSLKQSKGIMYTFFSCG